ncbi:membrane protein insertion efficiency factor YidD [Flaviflexus massiliensis]|uniref:membrane protein insertion efficiency factor YidD n=1 Tax=Flaviflexus massiliensis TaxID=1522309 RepID=UPI00097D1F8B|nr:membrane protein insertion efficiency factor YidD [Flaviflexus massiliensis]
MNITARAITATIRWYQRNISPRFAPRCRYYPSCSQYGLEAVQIHGASKGTLLASWRILRCNPWSKGGVDYVPEKGAWPSKPLGHDELMTKWNEENLDSAASRDNNSGEDTVPPQAQQKPPTTDALNNQRDRETRKD